MNLRKRGLWGGT